MLLLFYFIERSESARLIDAYPVKMQRYKILTGILLMLSVIDFAFAAPVVVQERDVRVSVVDATNDGTTRSPLRRDQSDKWPANAADRTGAPLIPRLSDSGYWRKQVQKHNPESRTDSNEPSNPAPPIELDDPPTPDVPPGFESASFLSTNQAPTDSNRPSDIAPSIDRYASHDPPSPSVPPGFESPYLPTSQAPAVSSSNRPSSSNHPPSTSVPPGFESTSFKFLPTDELDPLNPSSPHGNTDLNTSPYQGQEPTDNSDR